MLQLWLRCTKRCCRCGTLGLQGIPRSQSHEWAITDMDSFGAQSNENGCFGITWTWFWALAMSLLPLPFLPNLWTTLLCRFSLILKPKDMSLSAQQIIVMSAFITIVYFFPFLEIAYLMDLIIRVVTKRTYIYNSSFVWILFSILKKIFIIFPVWRDGAMANVCITNSNEVKRSYL